MGKGVEAARLDVINEFPGLLNDDNFEVTSPWTRVTTVLRGHIK